jgi:hypothetical protein
VRNRRDQSKDQISLNNKINDENKENGKKNSENASEKIYLSNSEN